jgi:hypothetical protein
MSIVAIGELKSHLTGPREITTKIVLVGSKKKFGDVATAFKTSNRQHSLKEKELKLSPAANDRLRRQSRRIHVSLGEAEKAASGKLAFEIGSERHLALSNLIQRATRGGATFARIGDGTLYGSYRNHGSLYTRCFVAGPSPSLDGIEDSTLALRCSERSDNSMLISHFFYHPTGSYLLPGMAPFFWWPLPRDVMHAIYFLRVSVFSIYNHAHLYRTLERFGFEVVSKYPNEIRTELIADDKRYVAVGFGHYVAMITDYLFDETFIVEAILGTHRAMSDMGVDANTPVRIDMRQEFGSAPEGTLKISGDYHDEKEPT